MANLTKRVLIVDDDEGIRRSLARIMRGRGFEVETADDGESAIEMARSFGPSLLIVDIRMREMNGIEAVAIIRAEAPHVTAIFMTAYASSFRLNEAVQEEALTVLSKPLDVELLVDRIDQLTKAESP